MPEAGVFPKMKIKIIERVGLQDQSGELSRPLEREQFLDQFKELLSLKIDGIEIKQLRRCLVTKRADARDRTLPKRHELAPFAYEVNRIHGFG
jgi:hypothetical protein